MGIKIHLMKLRFLHLFWLAAFYLCLMLFFFPNLSVRKLFQFYNDEDLHTKEEKLFLFSKEPIDHECLKEGEKIRVLFTICGPHWGSWTMRGIQIVDELKKNKYLDVFLDDDCGNIPSYNGKVDFCVYVKGFHSDAHFTLCNEAGGLSVYDNIDHDKSMFWSPEMMGKVDYYIASSHQQKAIVGDEDPVSLYVDRIWIIPHHLTSVNITKTVKHYSRQYPYQIGAFGLAGSKLDQFVIDEINKFCVNNGLPNFMYLSSAAMSNLQAINEFIQEVESTLDIIVLFPPASPAIPVLHTKPATRMLISMNIGIPTVMFPFPSYMEATQYYHYNLFAGNTDQLVSTLQYLIDTPEAMKYYSDQGHKIAKLFSIEKIGEIYFEHFRRAYCKAKKDRV